MQIKNHKEDQIQKQNAFLPGIVIFHKNKITYINQSAENFLKISYNINEIDNNDIFQLLFSDRLKNADFNKINILEIKVGKKNPVIAKVTEINKETYQVILDGNIEEKGNHELEQLNTILETSNHLIWFVNNKFELTNFNSNFADLIFEKYGFQLKIGMNISAVLTKEVKKYTDFWHPKYHEAFLGKNLKFIKEENFGRYICREIFIKPVTQTDSKINEICCVAHDITDSVLYERKVNSQTGRITAIFDSSQHYIWTIDRKGKLTSFNQNYLQLIEGLYHTKPNVGIELNRGLLANDLNYNQTLNHHYQKAFGGNATSFEIEVNYQNKGNIFLEIYLNPIYNKSKVVEVSGIAHNITDKKLVQQKMELSLKEKEILLREVHHRVKNNMQVISSILNLQSFYVKDQYSLSLLKESQNRISTMAYIHESLYQNNSFSSVNFAEYMKRLIRNIIASYSFNAENIELKQQIEEIALSLDVAIPLGLIINELITNSIKHAFPDNTRGLIIINLKTENNYVFLSLLDNGKGLPDGFSIEKSQSLGLQLVSTLMEQIGANYTLKTSKNKGTEFKISFQN